MSKSLESQYVNAISTMRRLEFAYRVANIPGRGTDPVGGKQFQRAFTKAHKLAPKVIEQRMKSK